MQKISHIRSKKENACKFDAFCRISGQIALGFPAFFKQEKQLFTRVRQHLLNFEERVGRISLYFEKHNEGSISQ